MDGPTTSLAQISILYMLGAGGEGSGFPDSPCVTERLAPHPSGLVLPSGGNRRGHGDYNLRLLLQEVFRT